MDNLINEINQDIAEEKYQQLFTVHGKKLIVTGILIILFTAAYKIYDSIATKKATATGSLFMTALDSAKPGDYAVIVAKDQKGYSPLAGLAQAGVLDVAEKDDDAITALKKISDELSNDRAFREISLIDQAYLMIKQKKSKQDILAVLEKVTQADSPFRITGLDLKASYLLEQGDKKEALKIYTELSKDNEIPATMQERAKHILAVTYE